MSTLTNADIALMLIRQDKRRLTLRGLLRLTLEMDGLKPEEIDKVLRSSGYMADAGQTYLDVVKKISRQIKEGKCQ